MRGTRMIHDKHDKGKYGLGGASLRSEAVNRKA